MTEHAQGQDRDQDQERDARSDPAHHAEGEGSDDWSSEGGAVQEGPATHPADGEDAPT